MTIFNRIVTILLLAILLALAVLWAAFPGPLIGAAQRTLETAGAALATLETGYFWLYVAARVLFVLLAVVVFGLLLWTEIRPRRPKTVKLQTEAGSHAEVTSDSVARRLTWHIDQLADVISVTPLVSPHGRTVDVVLDLETSPEIDVPMKTDEVVAVAREVIGERMGLQVGKVEVRIKHAPYQDKA
jgi:heme/copper-type cytochrome/quinol oxidase subunit 2